jgi:hypothetical protein
MIHVTKLIDRIKAAESRGSRDFVISLQEAKDIHSDLTKLLMKINDLQQQLLNTQDPTITVELGGGSFK